MLEGGDSCRREVEAGGSDARLESGIRAAARRFRKRPDPQRQRTLLTLVTDCVRPGLLARVRWLLSRTQEHEDLVQGALERVFDRISRLTLGAWPRDVKMPAPYLQKLKAWPCNVRKPTAYLRKMARHELLTVLKALVKRKRYERALPEDLLDVRQLDPCEGLIQDEQVEKLHAVFSCLDENDQAALMLRGWAQLSYSEIGDLLGINLRAARVRVHRARRRLTQKMRPGT